MPSAFQFKTFLTYWLDAVNEHSLHSPFFFDLYTQAIKSESDAKKFQNIEDIRRRYLQSSQTISVLDLGAGAQQRGPSRKVAEIAGMSLSPKKYSLLYARIIRHFQFVNIVELGTSLGINSLYLGALPGTKVTTFEGAPALAAIAQASFEGLEHTNIRLIEGDIATTLPSFLAGSPKIDFAFLDANHRLEPTLKYFQQLSQKAHARSLFILDDIHASPDMEKAWNELRRHPLIYGSADLYRCGLLFFDPSLNKQHVVLQF